MTYHELAESAARYAARIIQLECGYDELRTVNDRLLAERDKLRVINGMLCDDKNALLVQGAQLERERDALREDFNLLMGTLASAWFYGGWKAETPNEKDMQAMLEKYGWWPQQDEDALIAAIDAARKEQT